MNKLFFLLLCTPFLTLAQVGIGTTSPAPYSNLEISSGTDENLGVVLPQVALTSTDSCSPQGVHTQAMLVYNTSTSNGLEEGPYVDDGTQWMSLITNTPEVYATSLEVNTTINSSSWVTLCEKTFTAEHDNFLVFVSASGIGMTSSMATINFRVVDSNDPNTALCGTWTHMQDNDFYYNSISTKQKETTGIKPIAPAPIGELFQDTLTGRMTGGTIVTWNTGITGFPIELEKGTEYTLYLQARVMLLTGSSPDAKVYPVTGKDYSHTSFSVLGY
ncbi:hypothetical protein KC866_00505 [Patescibacteria group bacterium]|nr:hypothetical protein [Patescibacteria group bacterium]